MQPPPGFTRKRWTRFADTCAALLAEHGGELHRYGWTAAEIFGLDPEEPAECGASAGLALFLASGEGASVTGVHRGEIIYVAPSGECSRFPRECPGRDGVVAWEMAQPPRSAGEKA